jgi:predicted ATPase
MLHTEATARIIPSSKRPSPKVASSRHKAPLMGQSDCWHIMALLLGDRSVSLACLEEPAHSLHPRMMLRLADLFRQVTAQTDPNSFTPQILITTHNPELMDCFDLIEESDYLQVYLARRDEHGKTQFISATSEMLAPWLERYRLGEAVRRHFM